MKRLLGIAAAAAILAVYPAYAGQGVIADRLVDPSKSVVSFDIATAEGEDLTLTADYSSERPSPEPENMEIMPPGAIKEGTRSFTIRSKEGVPVNIQYLYGGGEMISMRISTESPNPASDAEYLQILSVESRAGHIINFTFVWQGDELKEVRIEPLINPFFVAT
ncbi:MAG: hypothetical protein JXB40_02470 [Candidatus Omnitrophica bacterium]|nr:hypothetical protein [Candidatus Omnitrophota bacterium]